MEGLPPGNYRVGHDLFGQMTFAAGIAVRLDRPMTPDQHVRLWSKVDLDELDARQVMGFVKWERGLPAAKAVVFMQNAYDFRKYVRRVEADDRGFFRLTTYRAMSRTLYSRFSAGEGPVMREFVYFGVPTPRRELTLHPHVIRGKPREVSPEAVFQLVRPGSAADTIVWTFPAEASGTFSVQRAAWPLLRSGIAGSWRSGRPILALRYRRGSIGGGRELVDSANRRLGFTVAEHSFACAFHVGICDIH